MCHRTSVWSSGAIARVKFRNIARSPDAKSTTTCARGPGADVGRGGPSPGADVCRVSPALAQMCMG